MGSGHRSWGHRSQSEQSQSMMDKMVEDILQNLGERAMGSGEVIGHGVTGHIVSRASQ